MTCSFLSTTYLLITVHHHQICFNLQRCIWVSILSRPLADWPCPSATHIMHSTGSMKKIQRILLVRHMHGNNGHVRPQPPWRIWYSNPWEFWATWRIPMCVWFWESRHLSPNIQLARVHKVVLNVLDKAAYDAWIESLPMFVIWTKKNAKQLVFSLLLRW